MTLASKERLKETFCICLMVTRRTKEMNATNLTQHFTNNFFIQFDYQETF